MDRVILNGRIEDVLPLVEQFVEATGFERSTLQNTFKNTSKWESTGRGLGMQVEGTCVTFWFDVVNDRLVAFYEPTSSVVYWDDVNAFIHSFGKPYTNAMNYHPLK